MLSEYYGTNMILLAILLFFLKSAWMYEVIKLSLLNAKWKKISIYLLKLISCCKCLPYPGTDGYNLKVSCKDERNKN